MNIFMWITGLYGLSVIITGLIAGRSEDTDAQHIAVLIFAPITLWFVLGIVLAEGSSRRLELVRKEHEHRLHLQSERHEFEMKALKKAQELELESARGNLEAMKSLTAGGA